jgi:type I restriction enzyme R subunit
VILTSFNEQHGTNFNDEDRIRRLIRDEIAPQVAQDQRYRNAKANTPNTAGIELDAALNRAVDPLFRRAVKELVEKLVDTPSAQIR